MEVHKEIKFRPMYTPTQEYAIRKLARHLYIQAAILVINGNSPTSGKAADTANLATELLTIAKPGISQVPESNN